MPSPHPSYIVKFNTLSEGQEPPPTTPLCKGKSVPLLGPCQLPLFPLMDYNIVTFEMVDDGLLPEPEGPEWDRDIRIRAWVRVELADRLALVMAEATDTGIRAEAMGIKFPFRN